MTKWPSPLRCKKRLAAQIGIVKATRIQSRLFLHTLSVANEIQSQDIADIQIAISGLSLKSILKLRKLKNFSNLTIQGKGSLGTRMRKQMLIIQRKMPSRKISKGVIFIGSDLPTLCTLDIKESIKLLNSYPLVIGPSGDGGYWLLGLSAGFAKELPSWPFSQIPWGTNKVLEKTTSLAKEKGIDYKLIQTKNDIDFSEDLLPWQK